MISIKELMKNNSQTTTNVTPPKISGRIVIEYVCFNVIFCVVVTCLGLFSVSFYIKANARV